MSYSKYAKPFTCILMNVPSFIEDGRRVTRSLQVVKLLLLSCDYRVKRVKPMWTRQGFRGFALVEFGATQEDCISAFKLERMFEKEGHGLADWVESGGSGIGAFLWVAREADEPLMNGFDNFVHVPYALRHEGRIEADNEVVGIEGSMSTLFANFFPEA